MSNSTWQFLKAEDSISGKEGQLYATINGRVEQVAECKSITAKITKNKTDFKSLGHRGTQHKATGWNGTGTLTIFYVTSKWAKMMIDYAHEGVDTYFQLQVINEDPTSSIGKQTVTLGEVNFDEAEIAKLDTGADVLEASMNFTFSDVSMANSDMFTAYNQTSASNT